VCPQAHFDDVAISRVVAPGQGTMSDAGVLQHEIDRSFGCDRQAFLESPAHLSSRGPSSRMKMQPQPFAQIG